MDKTLAALLLDIKKWQSTWPIVKVGAITTSGKEDFTINLSIEADHKDTTEPHEY